MNARLEPALPPAAGYCEFPASFAQQRLWFLDQLEGPGAVYNVKLPVRLRGALDRAALGHAVAAVVARHEALRTTFRPATDGSGELRQWIRSVLPVPVECVTLPAASEEQLALQLRGLAAHVFDLREGPLLRVFLVELAPDDRVLLLLTHHIVSDAWSSGVLFRDLAACYAAFSTGRSPVLPGLPVQYADYAVWQREWLAGAELGRQAAFWSEHLAGAPPLLELPVDRPRPRLQSYRGGRLGRGLTPALTTRLQALAAAEGVTLFMLLFAAFNLLLARWSGQDDLVVGTPIAGRRRTELEGLVGYFANTLALRTRLGGVRDFRGLLRQVRATALDAFAHQDLPFEKLVEVLQPARSLAHAPLFQVLFALQNTPWEAGSFGALAVAPAEIAAADTARFDLSVSAVEYEGRLWLGLEYCTALFDADTIGRLGRGFETLLAALVERPGADLAALPVQDEADRQRVLNDWNPASVAWPGQGDSAGCRVDALFAAQLARTPEATAVECAGLCLSYRELDARAAVIAGQLQGADLRHRPVAIAMSRSVDLLAAILAVWRAGGYYVPIDPGHPEARQRFILGDSGAELLVAGGGPAPVSVERVNGAGGRSPPASGTAAGDSPAYLIYTSGSTGRPKGVLVPHAAVVNFLASMAREPGMAPGDRLLAVTTLAFDIAVLELLLPLTVGATVVVADDGTLRDPSLLARTLAESSINVLQATPAAWRNLIAVGWTGQPGLRLFCGGEALDRELATALLARGAELWNLNGPTETTVWSCVARVQPGDGPVGVGRPIANTRCYVLDASLQPVPAGVRGELWIGGAGVALGYPGQPELTAERFRADPFATAGGRMYRTGDRARWRGDGQLEILGRTDFQLKLRGFRIEPGEIEAVLLAEPGITAAVVVLREFAGDPRLVAYLVPAAEPLAAGELTAALRAQLPDYMLPASFVWLPALPLNPNGKVDRQALPALVPEATPPAGEPQTALEDLLCGLFGELLGRAAGVDTDFFAAGGHSLLATRLVARIRSVLRIELPLRQVFETPTPRGLAAALPAGAAAEAEGQATGQSRGRPVPATGSVDGTAPLSLVQQRLWFLDRLQPGSSAYNLAWAFSLAGEPDLPALASALAALVARHASLRTRIVDGDGIPAQLVSDGQPPPLQQLAAAEGSALEQLLAERAAEPFNLRDGPLFRAFLIRQSGARHTLLLVVHHIVADGWSFGVINRDLSRLYAAARRGIPAELPALALDYRDHAVAERRMLSSGELVRQLEFWRVQLQGAPPFLELPTDRPRPALPSGRGARHSRLLPASLQASVWELAVAERCTPFMALLAAFAVLLARYAGTEDVLVGTPIAGRRDLDLENLVGFFVNTLMLRADLRGNPTGREVLARVRQLALDAYAHPDVPFEQLVEVLQPPRNPGRTPLFQVLFNLHSEPGGSLELDGLQVRPVAIPRRTAKFDLSVSLAETPGGLLAVFEYSTDLFLPETIGRLAADYERLLALLVADPGARLSALDFSPAEIREPALSTAPPWTGSTLPEVFGQLVDRQPGALAVGAPAVAGGTATDWSYAALSDRSQAVAAELRRQGLRPGDRVGLWFGQGAGQVAAMLGVSLAGGAWVPLDPEAPASRLAAQIRDAGIRSLVTGSAPPAPVPPGLAVLVQDELPAVASPPDWSGPASPDGLAYLLYTSGSTGTPKGVPQTHGNVLRQLAAWAGNLELAPGDRLSLLSTYGYDASVQDIFGALLSGAAVTPLDVRRCDRETLLDRIADRGLTVLHATPTVYRYLFGGHVACRQDLSRVRLVVLGGEVARRADFEVFRARFRRGARFVNGYGLTEATAVTQWFADHDTLPWGQRLPIGRPVGSQQVLLLDEAGETAGVTGEIVLEGAAVSPGYWPLRDERAAPGRFHTGDLARRLPDGSLAFAGRRDARLKLGGVRIEPGEIEMALQDCPGIGEALVVRREDVADEPVLEAHYTVVAPGSPPAVPALRAWLRARLPAAMVPARFQQHATLPRLPNGKPDRHALAAIPPGAGAIGAGDAAILADPGTVEAVLQSVWVSLLKLDRVGLDDDFFALGGHSLLATRLVARIRDRLGVEVPLIAVFEAPTIRGLTARMGRAGPGA